MLLGGLAELVPELEDQQDDQFLQVLTHQAEVYVRARKVITGSGAPRTE